MFSQRTTTGWARLFSSVSAASLPDDFLNAPLLTLTSPPSPPTPAQTALIRNFSDGHRRRRESDAPLLATILNTTLPDPPPATLSQLGQLWWNAANPVLSPANLIDPASPGPLMPMLAEHGIEIWHESELSALHALSWLILRSPRFLPLQRVRSAAIWAIEELQPDNATQFPWAAHVFAFFAADTSTAPPLRAKASHYAETLVHNALVGRDKPDILSAVILESSARWLRCPPPTAAP